MGGTAPANQLRLSFAGSEDGEAETETCRAAKPLWRTTTRTSGPRGLNSLNRRMRTRMYGGVAGESGWPLPLCRFAAFAACNAGLSRRNYVGLGRIFCDDLLRPQCSHLERCGSWRESPGWGSPHSLQTVFRNRRLLRYAQPFAFSCAK